VVLLRLDPSILFYYRDGSPLGIDSEDINVTSSYLAPTSPVYAKAITRVVANDEVKRMIWERERKYGK
jgi:hypothetical protein